MLMLLVISVFGTIGAILLARTYTGRLAKFVLIATGGLSLWLLLIANYAMLISNPVPQVMSYLILPIVSLAIMTFIINRVQAQLIQDNKKKKSA